MSRNLGVKGAYNRHRALNPISSEKCRPQEHNVKSLVNEGVNETALTTDGSVRSVYTTDVKCSSSNLRDRNENKILRSENLKLRNELEDCRDLLKQVTSDNAHEKFDERRLNLLKMQIVQLERQIALMNEAVCSRQESMLESENTMAWVADKMRALLASEVKGPQVSVARTDLVTIIANLESSRIKLFKTVERTDKDSIGKDLMLLNPFIGGKHRQGESLSLLDVSLNRMEYVNLKCVAQLESKLSVLYKELIGIQEKLGGLKNRRLEVGHASRLELDRLETAILKTCVKAKDVSGDLLSLTLLCPSAPWPPLKRPVVKAIPVERILSSLPTLPRSKQEEVKHVIESSLGVMNHRCLMLEKDKAALKEELDFHRAIYELQIEYTQALFEAVKRGYGEFEDSARLTIAEPIKEMLDAYAQLKKSASEKALRDFLVMIKGKEHQLLSVVDTLSQQNFEKDDTGSKAFSKFEEEFLNKLNSIVAQCQKERDVSISQKREVRDEQKRKDVELQQLIENLEAKYEKQWKPVNNSKTVVDETMPHNISLTQNAENHHLDSELLAAQNLEKSVAAQHPAGEETDSKCWDDPTLLRSYLYTNDEAKQSKGKKEWVNDFTEGGEMSLSPCNDDTKAKPKEKKKPTKKWKPSRGWVDDFAVPSTHLPKHDEALNSAVTSKFSTPDNDGQKGNRNLPMSYEPNLSVPKKTLKLRRYNSSSSIASKGLEHQRQNAHAGNGDKADSLPLTGVTPNSSRPSSKR